MNTRILSVLLIFFITTAEIVSADPAPSVGITGYYVGVARVTKISQPDDLSITTNLRVAARVQPDGTIAILTGVSDIPASAANVESSIIRLVRDLRGFYYADGVALATVAARGKNGLRIAYQNPPIIVQSSPSPTNQATANPAPTSIPQLPPNPPQPPNNVNVTLVVPEKYTKFEFTLTRK